VTVPVGIPANPAKVGARRRKQNDLPPWQICECSETAWTVASSNRAIIVDAEDAWVLAETKWSMGFYGKPRHYPAASSSSCFIKKRAILSRVVTNAPEGAVVDHANHNTSDNRKRNLRVCTKEQNSQNVRRARSVCPYRGVSEHQCSRRGGKMTRPWRAVIRANGRVHHLGEYATPEEAARAYDAAAMRLHGVFAILNFPEAA
jgi:hypothetical protein